MNLRHACLLTAILWGCGSETEEMNRYADAPTAESLGKGVEVEEGFTRYYSSVQEVPPGGSLNLVEWVAEPLDRDMDVVFVKGGQSLGGHHVTLNVSANVEEVGTVRDYDNADQLSSAFVGAAGDIGEGTSAFDYPEGYVFRAYEGQGLYLQTHYINLTDETIEVRSYVDVKLAEPSEEHTVMSLFSNSSLQTEVPEAAGHSETVECELGEDVELLMFANHMHEYGTAVITEAELPDGTMMEIKNDPVWNVDWQLDPNYTVLFDDPLVLPKGTTVRTHCEWENTADHPVPFPDEMCVFVGFIPSDRSMRCANGTWSVGAREPAGHADGATSRVGEGACSGDADFAGVQSTRAKCEARPRQDVAGCALPLFEGNSDCIVECFEEAEVATECGQCFGELIACNAQNCSEPCQADPEGEECQSCQAEECCPTFEACSGLSC